MKTISRANGNIVITLPDSTSTPTDITITRTVRKRGKRNLEEKQDFELETLLTALASEPEKEKKIGDYSVLDRFGIDLGEGKPPPQRRGVAEPEIMEIDVALAPNEGAVFLIEQDGTYEWHFPETTDVQRGPMRRGGPSTIEKKTAIFRIPIGEGEPLKPQRGAKRAYRGPVTNFIKGKIKGFILKFVARQVVGALSKRLEKGVEPGPVLIKTADSIDGWLHADNFLKLKLPKNRPARILLLVHGTFSSTFGSFGALTAHPAGQRFLTLALNHYDAIVGYDHYTLAETPAQNAQALFEDLLKLEKRSIGIEFDAISFSRGGLVYRYLTEQILPYESTQLAFRKAIFVGCTNAGTELANDENWKNLVDLYTNMVAGTSRLLGLLPGAKLPTQVFNQAIKIIGSLVKYMAQDGIADNSVPGLSAMKPDGKFVTAINTLPTTRTRAGAASYYAIGSDFEPNRDTSAGKLGKKLALKLADGFADQLMGEANDIVVDTDSMFIIDPVPSARLIEKIPFSKNGDIYHTVYFNQAVVARQCAHWLGLITTAQRNKLGSPRSWWKEAVRDDFKIISGQLNVGETKRHLENDNSSFVVIQRPHEGDLLHYGIPRNVLLDTIRSQRNKNISLIKMLDLHEYESRTVPLEEALGASNAEELNNRSGPVYDRYTSVVLDSGKPVGVVAPPEIHSTDDLLEELTPPSTPSRQTQRRALAKKLAKKKKRGKLGAGRGGQLRTGARPSAPGLSSSATQSYKRTKSRELAEALEPQPVWVNAHAVMPEEALIDKTTTAEVTLSRDEIVRQSGVYGRGKVDPEKDLIVQVLARKHCVVNGESRVEVPVPSPGQETQLFFDILPKHAGIGQVDVIIRQGNRPITTLKLLPSFVTAPTREVVDPITAEAELSPADNRRELPDVLYIREGEMGLKRVLHFDFESRSLNKIVRCTSEPFEDRQARENYIINLYQELENFWADSDVEYDTFMRKLQARGVEIFDKLIPIELRRVLWEARNDLKTIHVISDEPFIPWELAYLKEPGKKAKRDSYFLAEKGLVRWLAEAEQFAPLKLRLRKNKSRYVVPDYPLRSGYQLPGAQVEKKMLEKVLKAKAITPTSNDVLDAIENPGTFDILHFACHGLANPTAIWDAGLLMKGKMKNDEYQEDELLSSQVEAFGDLQENNQPGPLVFLNACQVGRQGYNLTGTGGFARSFVKGGAGAFVGTHWSIGDSQAVDFSKTLYQQLLKGKNMLTAVGSARKAAKNKKDVTWLSYVVYADPYAKIIK